MGFRYRKSIKFGKGIRLNINKNSVGISAGVKGARVSVNSNGSKTTTVSIPGAGVSYQSTSSVKSSKSESDAVHATAQSSEFSVTIMRAIGVILVPLGALCFTFSWFVAVVLILAGIITIFRANAMSADVVKKLQKKHPILSEFPDADEAGHEMLKILTVDLHGAMYIHDGVDPQRIIPQLVENEQLILEADPENEHDRYAVRVYTVNYEQIGWLPAGSRDVSNRLQMGRTVYARVAEKCTVDCNHTYDMEFWDPKKCWDNIKLEIARYSAK